MRLATFNILHGRSLDDGRVDVDRLAEGVTALDADVLVFQSGSEAERAGIEGDPVLSGLPTVTEGRSIFIEDEDYAALQFASALSLPYLLDGFAPELSEVVG